MIKYDFNLVGTTNVGQDLYTIHKGIIEKIEKELFTSGKFEGRKIRLQHIDQGSVELYYRYKDMKLDEASGTVINGPEDLKGIQDHSLGKIQTELLETIRKNLMDNTTETFDPIIIKQMLKKAFN